MNKPSSYRVHSSAGLRTDRIAQNKESGGAVRLITTHHIEILNARAKVPDTSRLA